MLPESAANLRRVEFLPGFWPLADRYNGFILDLWGVVHDGSALYPGVLDTILSLRMQGKKIVFLSNAPRRAGKAAEVLNRLGIDPALYEGVVTSGEVAHAMLQPAPPSPYYFLGPERDAEVLAGLPHTRVQEPEEAAFVLNAGFISDEQTYAQMQPLIERIRAADRPMLCINPDIEVVKISGERLLCAGYSAREYEKLGGEVAYVGKPYPEVYAACQALLGPLPPEQILAVGDSVMTDIAGAQESGYASAFVTGGIFKDTFLALSTLEQQQAVVAGLCEAESAWPDYVIPSFGD